MDAYTPSSAAVVAITLAIGFAAGLLGWAWSQSAGRRPRLARGLAWAAVVATIVAGDRVLAAEPGGVRMLLLVLTLLWAMKGVVAVEARIRRGTQLPIGRWCVFAFAWFGMRPALFAGERLPREDAMRHIAIGLVWLIVGVAIVVGLNRLHAAAELSPWVLTLPLCVGLSLALHFGLLRLATGVWRRVGFNVERLFRGPLYSRSLADFWGRRWNLAFSEMAAQVAYKPTVPLAGPQTASLMAFLLSGLLHELAISLPVQAGWGLPMLYFVVHAALMQAERRLAIAGWPRPLQHAWVIAALLLPLPLLFHEPFLREVLWPLLGEAT